MQLFRSMARHLIVFRSNVASSRGGSLLITSAIFFTALLMRAFPKPSGASIHCRTSGKLFNLSRLRAQSKVRQLFIRELLYADDTTFVANSTSTLQNLCRSFTSACAELNTTISLRKTVVLSQRPSSTPQISINGAVLQIVDKVCVIWGRQSTTQTP